MPVNKTKQRLEELEKEPNQSELTRQVEQQVYVDHVQSLHDELIHAWETENNRVKALKIAIRVTSKKSINDYFYLNSFLA